MRAHEMHVVLEGDGDAGQRAESLSPGTPAVGLAGSREGEVCGDLEEGLDLGLACVDGREGRLRDLGGGEVAGGDACRDLGCGELVESCHQRSSSASPRMEGTRK